MAKVKNLHKVVDTPRHPANQRRVNRNKKNSNPNRGKTKNRTPLVAPNITVSNAGKHTGAAVFVLR
jgi:hypothetical protein